MRRISVVWIAALAAVAASGADRPGVIMSGSGEFNGYIVRFTTVAEPPLAPSQAPMGGIWDQKDRVQRFMADTKNRQYFGYDIGVDPGGAPNRYRVRIEPLSLRPDQIYQGPDGVPSPILLPKYPPPQIVEAGDTIVLDLLVSPDGRQKIVDYIQVERIVDPGTATNTAEPRDFTLDDGPLTFSFRLPTKLLVNGQAYPGTTGMTGKPGGTLWFAFPGHGRYILSLAPHNGFQKAGAIRDNVIVFRAGGEQYELRTSGPIVGSGGAWNLYLFQDLAFQGREYAQYGTDRLENLVPKR